MEQDKKECILQAAARAFARYGFKKAAIEEIARAAGVAKGTIYLACDTKEDLFYQSVHREVRQFTAELSKLIDPRVPADQLLQQSALAGIQYLRDRPLVRELLFGHYHMMLPDWAERLDGLRELGRANVLEILRLGVRQGVFRDDLDLDEVAKILQDFAISNILFYDRGVNRDAKLQKRLQTAAALLLNGIRPAKARSKHEAA